MYSAPFFLMFEGELIITQIPYEAIANNLLQFSVPIDYSSLSYSLKLQARLESALPEVGYLRDIYAFWRATGLLVVEKTISIVHLSLTPII